MTSVAAMLSLWVWSPWVVRQAVPEDAVSREVTVQRNRADSGTAVSVTSREITVQRIVPGGLVGNNLASREVTVIYDPNKRIGTESREVSVSMPTTFKLNLTFSDLVSQTLAPNSIGYELLEHNSTVNFGSGSVARGGDGLFPFTATRRVYDVRCIVPAPFLNRLAIIDARAGFATFAVTIFTGDVDDSGEVDAADIDAVIANFGSTDPIIEDLDLSGEVDAADIDIVIANFGQTDQ